jgi:hypothetical protein
MSLIKGLRVKREGFEVPIFYEPFFSMEELRKNEALYAATRDVHHVIAEDRRKYP